MSAILAWKNELPRDWRVVPLKAVASYWVSGVDKLTKEDEEPVELCNYTDVYKNDFITSDLDFMKATATQEEIEKFALEEGDVLITKDSETWDDIGIPALVVETKPDLLCGYHLAIIRPNRNYIHPDFLFYCILSKEIRIQVELASTGVTRYGLPKDDIGRMYLPLPSVESQEAIANQLAVALNEIEALIKAKENLLSFISEKRQSLITEAVTKGLNPQAAMKETEIDWLGEMPEHWQILQLKFLATEPLKYGANEAALDDNPNNPRFVRITDIDEQGNLRPETFKSLDPELAKPYLLEEGDVLFARSGATVGKAFMYQETWGKACFAGYLIRMRCDKAKLLPAFLFFVTQSEYYWSQINAGLIQATIQNFSGEKYGSMKILLPNMSEQKEIVNYLEKELSKMNALKNLTEVSIAFLNERKNALIFEAVTGKLKMIANADV